jgi:lipopolysaccharide biosynthesis glycosyltransferase
MNKRNQTRHSDYTYGAAVLLKSLQHHITRDYVDYILLETPLRPIAEMDRAYLKRLGWNICTVTPIEPKHYNFGRFVDQFAKLHLWSFVQYETVIYLDSDTLVVGNLDSLVDSKLEPEYKLAATRDYLYNSFADTFNMGVFLIHPNLTEFHRLVRLQQNDHINYDHVQSEQGFVNVVYRHQWKDFGTQYNANMALWARGRNEWPLQPIVLHFTLKKGWMTVSGRRNRPHPLSEFLDIWKEAAKSYGVEWQDPSNDVAEVIAEDRRNDKNEAALDVQGRNALNTTFLFGFYLQAHKQAKATFEVVKSIKTHMPSAPLYLLSSAGLHFDPLQQRFENLRFVYDSENIDLPKGVGNLTRFFERIKKAALWCNCSYLVLMEDDTYLHKPLTQRPPHDAGGVTAHLWSWKWSDALKGNFSGVSEWSYESSGMCGGSYIRVEAFLDAYCRTNWTRIQEMNQVMTSIGRYNDVTLAVILMDQGYILRPWRDLTQISGRRRKNPDDPNAPLVHRFKNYYNQPLSEQDGPVISDQVA